MEAGEKAIIMQEMRNFLTNLTHLVEAANENRLDDVAIIAAQSGQAQVEMVPPSLMMKLPMDFKKLGHSVHGSFDKLAKKVEVEVTQKEVLTAVSDIMNRCISCHATFQIVTSKE